MGALEATKPTWKFERASWRRGIPVEEFELARLRLDGGKYAMQGNSEFRNQPEGQSSGQSMRAERLAIWLEGRGQRLMTGLG